MNSQEIIKLYEEQGGLLRGHFLLSSGLHSDTYLQSEKVMMQPHIAAKVVAELPTKLKDISFDTVVSPAIGGIRFGYELARQMSKRSVFTERVDGVMELRRGFEFKAGERVIVAEDVVTTGKSTKECIDAVKRYGGQVVAVASIIDRSDAPVDFGTPFYPLAKVDVQTWTPENCPECKKGTKAIKPGSRK